MDREQFEVYVATLATAWSELIHQGLRQVEERERRANDERCERKQEAERELTKKREAISGVAWAILPDGLMDLFPGLSDAITQAVNALELWRVERIANNSYRDESLIVDHQPAGLAPVRLIFSLGKKPPTVEIQVPRVKTDEHGAPYFGEFADYADLAEVLFQAARAGAQHEELLTQYQADEALRQADEAQRQAALAADERRREAESAARAAEQHVQAAEDMIEMQRLIAWAVSDPAALSLVRTFMTIEEDRARFAVEIENADSAASYAQQHLDARCAQLRRDVADARAEADRQREEARRAQDDAEDARRKIKDVECRARSYAQ